MATFVWAADDEKKSPITEGRFDGGLDATVASASVTPRGANRLFGRDFAVECWVKLTPGARINYIVSSEPKDSRSHWGLYSYKGGVFSASLGGYTPSDIRSKKDIRDGEWHHVRMQLEKNVVLLIVDAQIVANVTVTPKDGVKQVMGPLLVGRSESGGCHGVIDELKVVHGVSLRTPTEIPTEASDRSKYSAGHWRFDVMRDDRTIRDQGRYDLNLTVEGSAESETEVIKKSPLPSEDDIKDATAIVDELVNSGFGGEVKATDKTAIANKLHELAADETDNVAARYVCLQKALAIAVESGKLELAMDVIDEIGRGFEVDATKMKLDTLSAMVSKLKRPIDYVGVAQLHLSVASDAIDSDRFEVAAELVEAASKHARLSRFLELITHIKSITPYIEKLKAGFGEVANAKKVLEDDAENADANSVMGQYLCLHKNEWEDGLAMLMKGSDFELKAIALMESTGGESADDFKKIADRWYVYAKKQTGSRDTSNRAMHRAGHWYGQASDLAKGITKASIDLRLKEIEKVPAVDSTRMSITFGRRVDWSKDRTRVEYRWITQNMYKKATDPKHTAMTDADTERKTSGVYWKQPIVPSPVVFAFPEYVRPRMVRIYLYRGSKENCPPGFVALYAGTSKKPGQLLSSIKPDPKMQEGWITLNVPNNSKSMSKFFWIRLGSGAREWVHFKEIEFR